MDKIQLVYDLKAAGKDVKDIARRAGTTVDYVEGLLAAPDATEAIEASSGKDEGIELYSPEEIRFFAERMFPKALAVIELVLTQPTKVTATQWRAAEWVLSKAQSIQEMDKRPEGVIKHEFYMSDKAAEAINRMTDELGGKDWMENLEKSINELPEGIQ